MIGNLVYYDKYNFIETALSTEEKIKDFKFLFEHLKSVYPFFDVNKRLNGIDWLANREKYLKKIKITEDDLCFFLCIKDILNDLHNGHTNIQDGHFYRWLYERYFSYYKSTDELEMFYASKLFNDKRVLSRYKFNSNELKCKAHNNGSGNLFLKSLEPNTPYIKIARMLSGDEQESDLESITKFLKSFKRIDKLIIDIRGNGGGDDIYWMRLMAIIISRTYCADYHSFFKESLREESDVHYISNLIEIYKVDSSILNIVPQGTLKNYTYYKNNTIEISPNIHSLNLDSKIYLLTDGKVFSSAEKFASFAKDSNFATLVGGKTGGDRIFEVLPLVVLPNSKFLVRYSRELSVNSYGKVNMEMKTTPHIEVEASINKNLHSDKCIKTAIEN